MEQKVQRGFALPVAVFALVIVGIITTGGFFMARQEGRIGTASEHAGMAFYLTEQGLVDVMDNWEPMYVDHDIALVITDLRMRKLDGLSLIRRIIGHDPNAAIIAVSGLAQHLDAAEASGARAGLVKPVRPEDLIETV